MKKLISIFFVACSIFSLQTEASPVKLQYLPNTPVFLTSSSSFQYGFDDLKGEINTDYSGKITILNTNTPIEIYPATLEVILFNYNESSTSNWIDDDEDEDLDLNQQAQKLFNIPFKASYEKGAGLYLIDEDLLDEFCLEALFELPLDFAFILQGEELYEGRELIFNLWDENNYSYDNDDEQEDEDEDELRVSLIFTITKITEDEVHASLIGRIEQRQGAPIHFVLNGNCMWKLNNALENNLTVDFELNIPEFLEIKGAFNSNSIKLE
jgi:hypothetical protein